jgi:hypothetical protein
MGLLLSVVVHWNAIYMQEVITQLKTEGWVIEDADLARLSPLIWRHICSTSRLIIRIRRGARQPTIWWHCSRPSSRHF